MAHAGHAAHRQPFSRRERASNRFRAPDHPPRGCRFPRPEARNRGYSCPSGGRVRALQWILRPWITPNRPQTSRMAVRAVRGMIATQSARDPAYARLLAPRRSRPSSRSVGSSRITSTGSSATTGRCPVAAPGTGFGGWTTPPLPWRAGKNGVRGGGAPRQPPAGDARSVATRSRLACLP